MDKSFKNSREWVLFLFVAFMVIYALGQMIGYNILVFTLLFATFLPLVFFSYKWTGLFESPLIWWEGFWLLFIVIARFPSSHPEIVFWSAKLFWLIYINTAIFFLVFYWIYASKLSVRIGRRISVKIGKANRRQLFFLFVTALSGTGIAAFFLLVLEKGYIPVFSQNLGAAARRAFSVSGFASIFNICRIGAAFVPLLKYKGCSKKQSLIAHGAYCGYLLCCFLSGWRFQLFQALIMYMTTYFMTTKLSFKQFGNVNPLIKKAIKYGVFMVVFFVSAIFLRHGINGKSLLQIVEYVWNYFYMYVSPQFINIEQAIDMRHCVLLFALRSDR